MDIFWNYICTHWCYCLKNNVSPSLVLRPPRKEATSGLPYIVVVVTSWKKGRVFTA